MKIEDFKKKIFSFVALNMTKNCIQIPPVCTGFFQKLEYEAHRIMSRPSRFMNILAAAVTLTCSNQKYSVVVPEDESKYISILFII